MDQGPFCGATDCFCFGLCVSLPGVFLSWLCVVIQKVKFDVTSAFLTNKGVYCISMYTAWQLNHFDPHTCSHQVYPQALVAPRSELGLEPMAWAGAQTHDLLCRSILSILHNLIYNQISDLTILIIIAMYNPATDDKNL